MALRIRIDPEYPEEALEDCRGQIKLMGTLFASYSPDIALDAEELWALSSLLNALQHGMGQIGAVLDKRRYPTKAADVEPAAPQLTEPRRGVRARKRPATAAA